MSAPGLYTSEEIYRLIPALYRIRDVEQGGVLRELVDVVTEQVNALAESIEQTYDDQFIETCAEWVAPYVGDLISYRTLHGVVPRVASPRAEVANTIRYRRRKGTASMLEQLAGDVTGWPARAVELFELLATTQYMNHVRPHAAATALLRDETAIELGRSGAGAFDGLAHTAEMRRVGTGSGRYNIPNVAIFLWRVQANRVTRSPLVAADASGRRFRLDPLGTDKPLFGSPRTEESITHLAEPFDVPLALTRRWLKAHRAEYYGAGKSLLFEVETSTATAPIAAGTVSVCDLSDDPANPGAWAHEPAAADAVVAVDPVLGRVAFPAAAAAGETRLATFHHGSALDVGGGGYDRGPAPDDVSNVVLASGGQNLGPLLVSVEGGGGVQITDFRRYAAPASVSVKTPAAGAADRSVVLRSSNRMRPLLTRTGQVKLAMEPDTTFVLDGVTLEGAPLVVEDFGDTRPRTLVLRHCTLVPGVTRTPGGGPGSVGSASLIVLHPFTSVTIEHCFVGPIVAVEGTEVTARDSIVDASGLAEIAVCGREVPPAAGTVTTAADRKTGDGLAPCGHLTLDACTVVGRIHAQQLDVSNSLLLAALPGAAGGWPAPVWVERRQTGCIRFSYVPAGSRTPRRFKCAGDDPAHRPHHTSLRFGDPGYAQLRRSTHPAIRTGADDASEMGVTHELYQPQRESNLRLRLDEYLRFGLEAGFFYAT